jgi:hypothetical protein
MSFSSLLWEQVSFQLLHATQQDKIHLRVPIVRVGTFCVLHNAGNKDHEGNSSIELGVSVYPFLLKGTGTRSLQK